MRCVVVKEDIFEPVTRAEKSTGKNHTLPILSCVLLSVQKNNLTVTATNLEVGVEYSVPVQDSTEGVVAVSGAVLAQTISTFPTGSKIILEVQGGYLSIQGAGSESKIALQDTNEFPNLPKVDTKQQFTLPAKVLRDAITSVSYCASTSTIKPELSSVYIYPHGGTLITTATDSFRLAEKQVPLQQPVTSEPFLVPARSTADMLKILELTSDNVTVSINDHQLSLQTEQAYITLRLTTGVFPDYTQIIPKSFITEATILRADLERVLRRAAVFADQFNQTTLTLTPKKKQFSIFTQHTAVGETKDTLSAIVKGDELTIRFNQRYLLDALHSITTDSIVLQFAGTAQPAVIRPVGDTTFLYLVMPMNR